MDSGLSIYRCTVNWQNYRAQRLAMWLVCPAGGQSLFYCVGNFIYFTVQVIEQLNKLPRKDVEFPSLETLKASLDTAQRTEF